MYFPRSKGEGFDAGCSERCYVDILAVYISPVRTFKDLKGATRDFVRYELGLLKLNIFA